MPYVGGKLAPWFGTGPIKTFMHEAADEGGGAMTRNVKLNTPVDTGHLIESIQKKLVVVYMTRRGLAYESGAETHVDYAPHVEYGTGLWGPLHAKYEIRPKRPDGWLRWIDPHTGQPVFAKRVMHPGSPGAHMFARGAALTEAEFDRIVARRLKEWAREQELSNPYAHPGYV